MGLAVLVFEMPTTCEDCPCCIIHENQYGNIVSAQCGAIYKGWIDERTFEKHELCPLKPLPEYEKPQDPDETWEEMHVRMGYNKCLEDITGE